MIFGLENSGVSPDASLSIAVVSAIAAILVAFMGYLGVRHRTPETPPAQPQPPEEPEWILQLRRDLSHERTLREQHDVEIERLQRLLYINGIDPTTGGHIEPRGAT